MIKIMKLSKYKAIERLVVDLDTENIELKKFNKKLEDEIKRLEKKLHEYETEGVEIKAELPFDEEVEEEFTEYIADYIESLEVNPNTEEIALHHPYIDKEFERGCFKICNNHQGEKNEK